MKALAPASIAAPFARYSHGVAAAGGRIVATSGQLGLRADGSVPVTAQEQTLVCLHNVEAILAEAGLAKHAVMRLNAYVTAREHMAGYMAARDAWLEDVPVKPASTLVIVSGFTRPEFLVEVEALAVEES